MPVIQQTYARVLAAPVSQDNVGVAGVVRVGDGDYSLRCFVREARLWPSALGEYLGESELCCRIHEEVDKARGLGVGCSGVDIGYHKSIRAVYDGGTSSVRCFAAIGQLVLDRAVAHEALRMTNFGGAVFGAREVAGRKYRRGLPIAVAAYGAGYCYLHGFPDVVRSRVARILGPLPLVADVLRVSRILGDQYVYAKWTAVGEGLYHVEAVNRVESIPEGYFLKTGWDLVRVNPNVRVGLAVGGLCDWVFSLFGAADRVPGLNVGVNVQAVGVAGGVDSDVGGRFSDEVDGGVNHSGDQVTEPVDGLGKLAERAVGDDVVTVDRVDVVKKQKVECLTCGFLVNPDGHDARCRVVQVDGEKSLDFFFKSWLGDVVHRRDVRIFVMFGSHVRKRDMGTLESQYVCKEHQAAFYVAYEGDKEVSLGSSAHSLSSAFEASYHGKFREDYMMKYFGQGYMAKLPAYVEQFCHY